MSGSKTSGPYNPLQGPGMQIVLYGTGPIDPSPRIPGDGLPYWPVPMVPTGPSEWAEALRKLMEQQEAQKKVDPPPASAADSEVNAVNVLAALTPEERARVLRFAVSKWGPVTV